MDGVKVTRDGASWVYSPEAYWPVTPVNFYAFSPEINVSADITGEGGPCFSDLTEDFLRQGGYAKYWDEDAQAAYLWNGSSFISYESPEALALKCRYVREQGLRGIMYWEHGCDKTHQLLQVLRREMESR